MLCCLYGRILRQPFQPLRLWTAGQGSAGKCPEPDRGLLHADPREVTFTSGGSEADNQAIMTAAALGMRRGKKHIVSTAFEHHAVLHTLEKLKKQGFEVTLLDVHNTGLVRPEQVLKPSGKTPAL